MMFEFAILAVVAAFILLFVTTALLEKQLVHEYIPAPPEQACTGSPYFQAMNDAARRLGFEPAGVFVQSRGSRIYQARLMMWLSSDRQSLLRVVGGKTMGVNIRRTMFISFVEPDRVVETADEFGGADLSGLRDCAVLMNASLEELHVRHLDRLAAWSAPKRVFSVHEAMTACEVMQAMRAAQMEKIGLGKFLNRERTVWRHTLRGAWLCYFKGFRAQLAEGKAQMHRAKLKRPGDAS